MDYQMRLDDEREFGKEQGKQKEQVSSIRRLIKMTRQFKVSDDFILKQLMEYYSNSFSKSELQEFTKKNK